MSDDIWTRDEIVSPCIKICVIEPETRLCTGCLRTIDEITQWSRMAHQDRANVMAALPLRAPLLQKRKGGRAARLARRTGTDD
jgi:hypothetical protein